MARKEMTTNVAKTNVQQPSNSWVILLNGDGLETSSDNKGCETPDIVNLRHPNTGNSALFLFSSANQTVQEIFAFDEAKSSWFIGDSIKSEGKIHISTPIDPLFLVLPYLRKYCTSQAIPLDQLLQDEEFPETERLINCNGLKYLHMISDGKGKQELKAFKYNEEKTLSWLKMKTRRVASILETTNSCISKDEEVSASFTTCRTPPEKNAYLEYAFEIVSEYLTHDLSNKLGKYFYVEENNVPCIKRKSSITLEHDSTKKLKLEENSKSGTSNVLNSNRLETKSIKMTSKDKARMKAANGMRSINLFFNSK